MVAGCSGGDGVDVEVRQSFRAGEVGVVDASGAASGGAVVDLGGQDFGEVAEVGVAVADGDLREAGGFGADGG